MITDCTGVEWDGSDDVMDDDNMQMHSKSSTKRHHTSHKE